MAKCNNLRGWVLKTDGSSLEVYATWPPRELYQQVRCCSAMTSRPMTSQAWN